MRGSLKPHLKPRHLKVVSSSTRCCLDRIALESTGNWLAEWKFTARSHFQMPPFEMSRFGASWSCNCPKSSNGQCWLWFWWCCLHWCSHETFLMPSYLLHVRVCHSRLNRIVGQNAEGGTSFDLPKSILEGFSKVGSGVAGNSAGIGPARIQRPPQQEKGSRLSGGVSASLWTWMSEPSFRMDQMWTLAIVLGNLPHMTLLASQHLIPCVL